LKLSRGAKGKKGEEKKKVLEKKKTYRAYNIKRNKIHIMRIPGEKIKRKRQNIYLKQKWLKTSQTWGEKWLTKFMKSKNS